MTNLPSYHSWWIAKPGFKSWFAWWQRHPSSTLPCNSLCERSHMFIPYIYWVRRNWLPGPSSAQRSPPAVLRCTTDSSHSWDTCGKQSQVSPSSSDSRLSALRPVSLWNTNTWRSVCSVSPGRSGDSSRLARFSQLASDRECGWVMNHDFNTHRGGW